MINALETGNKIEINLALKEYKHQNGLVNYTALFEIKPENRLPNLYKNNPVFITTIVSGALTLAMESMNISRPMKAEQIIDLADIILESSSEDNLALEDLMLFLQKFIRGEYGKIYESMDIPKFMEFFEKYREQRFQAIRNLREEQHSQSKTLARENRDTTLKDLLDKTRLEHPNNFL